MVKLIRLATDDIENDANADITARFNNNLNADLVLEPFSQVALLNCALDTLDSEIVIDGRNNQIVWSIGENESGGTVSHISLLDLGTYNSNNIDDFLLDMSKSLNQRCSYLTTDDNLNELGIEWNLRIVNRKLQIWWARGFMAQNESSWIYEDTQIVFDVIAGRPNIRAFIGLLETDAVTTNCLFKTHISKGCGVHMAQIAKLVASPADDYAKNGFIIGLSTSPIYALQNDEFRTEEISYGLKVSITSAGAQYSTWLDGDETVNSTVPNYAGENNVTNDWLKVGIDGGKIIIGICTDASSGNFVELESYDYDGETELYPFIVFNSGAQYTRLRYLFTTISFFNNNNQLTDNQTILSSDVGFLTLPAVPVTGILNNIVLSKEVADFCGYTNPEYPPTGTETQGLLFQWIGDTIFNAGNISDSFLVLLDNLQLESYDGLVSQRKNILYTIDSSDDTGKLVYEVPNPIYIDLNNQAPIALRNIRARILNNDYTDIRLLERGFMTILIQRDPTRS